MKKTLLLLITGLLFSSGMAFGQSELSKSKYKYLYFSFALPEYTAPKGLEMKSRYGVAITSGQTYFVHKEPIKKMIKFGIDVTWLDLNYTNYKEFAVDYSNHSDRATDLPELHHADLSIQVGPSIHINPVDRLHLNTYFRVAPTYSAIYDNTDGMGGYGTYFVTGGTVYYGNVGLGAEYRFGNTNLKPYGESKGGDKWGKTDFSEVRFHISVRF